MNNWFSFPNWQEALQQPSVWVLILSNLLVIGLAVAQNWNILSVLWVYWFQSVIIGVFTIFKILLASKTAKAHFISSPDVALAGHAFVAFFFFLSYAIFHLTYAVFLMFFSYGFVSNYFEAVNWGTILLAAGAFLVAHLFSFITHLSELSRKAPDEYFIQPYARIVPMHVTIIFAGFMMGSGIGGPIVLVFFMALKMVFDVGAHIYEHRINPKVVY